MTGNIQWLTDRAKIHDTFTRYSIAVDSLDWDLLQSIFVEDIERDLSSFTGGAPEKIKSQQHVTECQATLPGFDSTQHFLLNNEIVINGDTADATVYMMADHTLTDDDEVQKQFTIRGIYKFVLIRLNSEWKINRLELKVHSTQGDQGLFATAAQRAAA